MKKQFNVTITRLVEHTTVYEIEANTKEEALDLYDESHKIEDFYDDCRFVVKDGGVYNKPKVEEI